MFLVRCQHWPGLVRDEQHNCLIASVPNTGLATVIKPSTDRKGLRVVLAIERHCYVILDMTKRLGRAPDEESRYFKDSIGREVLACRRLARYGGVMRYGGVRSMNGQ